MFDYKSATGVGQGGNFDRLSNSAHRKWEAEVDDRQFGLAALGMSGDVTVEVLSRPDGGFSMCVETPGWCFEFKLATHNSVRELAAFLHSQQGQTSYAKLVVGACQNAQVIVIKDDEFADRFFLRSAGSDFLVDFTFCDQRSADFALAVAHAASDLVADV